MIAASLINRLADPSLVREQALLAGEWVDAAARIEVRNPSTGELLAEVADMALPDIRRAIVAADVAQRLWAEATGKERAAILRRWYDLVVANTDDLATILTAEWGKHGPGPRAKSPAARAILNDSGQRPSAFTVISFPATTATSALLSSSRRWVSSRASRRGTSPRPWWPANLPRLSRRVAPWCSSFLLKRRFRRWR